MTLDQFIERFAEEAPKHRWELWAGGCLRTPERASAWPCCPIEVASGGDIDSRVAAAMLGLPDDLRYDIQDAADNNPGHDPKIRRRLLECCGLTEETR